MMAVTDALPNIICADPFISPGCHKACTIKHVCVIENVYEQKKKQHKVVQGTTNDAYQVTLRKKEKKERKWVEQELMNSSHKSEWR